MPFDGVGRPAFMANLSPQWAAMAKLVSQFYAKADSGEKFRSTSTSTLTSKTSKLCTIRAT